MRVTGFLTLALLILAELSLAEPQDPKAKPCTGDWQGTIIYRVITKKEGTAENNVNVSWWNFDGFYETKAQLDGARNAEGAQVAFVRAEANEKKEWGSRGKGVCYRETSHSQSVMGVERENTTAFSVTINPRTREYMVLAPTLMVYASGEHLTNSSVKGTCNNPYNKNLNQVEKLDRYQLSDDAPALMGKGQIDPAKPNELAGSATEEHDTNRGKKTVTIKWDLRRCSAK